MTKAPRKRLFESEIEHPCPTCLAYAGHQCTTASGFVTEYPHASRHAAWCNTKGKTRTIYLTGS